VRDTLAASLLGSTLFSAAKASGAAPRWPMRLSTSTIQFSSLPLEKACERIAALGFEAVDIWDQFGGNKHLPEAEKLGGEGLAAMLGRLKLKLYAFSLYASGYGRYAEVLGKAGGGVAIRGSAGACKPEELAAKMKTFLQGLKGDAELAEKHNSYLAIENHGGALLNSLDSFKAFVDANTNPRIGIALAPHHLQAVRAPVEETIAIAGKQLLFFYAWQHAPAMNQLPGKGPANFTPWIAALAKAGYAGYVNPFMHGHPEPEKMAAGLANAANYLKKCYDKAVPV
jgi:sugar phosphate isomerase/epimerase